jgi:ribose transport system ATP-binding protein
MVGRAIDENARRATADRGAPILSVRDLSLEVSRRQGKKQVLAGVSFDLHRGEVLGIGGLLGAGRTEILETIFGSAEGRRSGRIAVSGADVEIGSPIAAQKLGIALVPEDRKARGLHLAAPIRDNVALPSIGTISRFGFRAFAQEAALARKAVADLRIRCEGIEQPAMSLSGGNQQKVVIAKWLATGPRILLLDEPTRGIDVGAKREIYDLIFTLAGDGMAIVVVTSELPELLLLSDRILVMCEGRMTGMLDRAEATQEAVMRLAAPGSHHALRSAS